MKLLLYPLELAKPGFIRTSLPPFFAQTQKILGEVLQISLCVLIDTELNMVGFKQGAMAQSDRDEGQGHRGCLYTLSGHRRVTEEGTVQIQHTRLLLFLAAWLLIYVHSFVSKILPGPSSEVAKIYGLLIINMSTPRHSRHAINRSGTP